MNQIDQMQPSETDEIYITLGLPLPKDAYHRVINNIKTCVDGKWHRIWWKHRIEPLAAALIGIEEIKFPIAYIPFEKFEDAYGLLAEVITEKDNLLVPLSTQALGSALCKAHAQLKAKEKERKLKERRGW